jgi:membrane-associated protease RseP (regulator of RpoE activity)
MSRDLWLRRACWVGSVAVLLAAGAVLQTRVVQAQDVIIRRIQAVGEGPAQSRDSLILVGDASGDAEETAVPAYWIGLICDPPDAALRAQLKLKEGGLVVRETVADAPAAKAGVKVYDVLLAVGDKELTDIRSLVDAVEKSEGKEITLHLLRGGEKQTVKVTPTKREKMPRAEDLPGEVRRWIELHRAGPDGWRTEVRPGVLGLRALAPHKLPKDMTVTITKEGESPAKIVVKQGDKTWETTEDKLKDLPEEVRKHVAPMVRPGAGFFTEKLTPIPPVAAPVVPFEFDVPRAAGERKLEKQVEDLKKQIDKLQKAVEAISKAKGEKGQ